MSSDKCPDCGNSRRHPSGGVEEPCPHCTPVYGQWASVEE
ncbi:hypothetical protein LI90_3029 [Carbonactinospora thermoautotrophica]|uniref:Uncharacterized protein n=1 Tax=Carbonactinospora thermoautotrophica TaxID=1469144 RepID=A0A132MW05_9ACTN|nr:hypothetical protein LI90_3029 [Carbonactinospora thermoautotrophica]